MVVLSLLSSNLSGRKLCENLHKSSVAGQVVSIRQIYARVGPFYRNGGGREELEYFFNEPRRQAPFENVILELH